MALRGKGLCESRGAEAADRGAQISLPSPLVSALFLSRPNRFAVRVRLADGAEEYVHLPDPGRLRELLVPGARLWLSSADGPRRKTHYQVLLAETDAGLISLDTRLPTLLVRRALEQRAVPEFSSYGRVRPEVRLGHSRIDFLLSGPGLPDLLLEVKSVTLVEDGIGLFPDAVTERGTRHLRKLAAAVQQGYQAAVLFIVQREDATAVRGHVENDPAFARTTQEAADAGVRFMAYTCRVTLETIALARSIPVHVIG